MIDFNGDGKFGFLEYQVLQKDYEKEQIIKEFKERFKQNIDQDPDILLENIINKFNYKITRDDLRYIEREINKYFATYFK
jgi:hypothetical protein